jgi:hypothetical protein
MCEFNAGICRGTGNEIGEEAAVSGFFRPLGAEDAAQHFAIGIRRLDPEHFTVFFGAHVASASAVFKKVGLF